MAALGEGYSGHWIVGVGALGEGHIERWSAGRRVSGALEHWGKGVLGIGALVEEYTGMEAPGKGHIGRESASRRIFLARQCCRNGMYTGCGNACGRVWWEMGFWGKGVVSVGVLVEG